MSPPVAAVLPLLVAAAANMRPALEALKPELQKAAGERVEIRYGATGTLARQIENGAPYDLFLGADETTALRLADEGWLERASVRPYAVGRLVLVAATDAGFALPKRLDGATALAFAKLPFSKMAVASPKTAPYGHAAQEVLSATGIFDAVKDRVVWAENVEQALAFVRSGNAPVGFVALSLAAGSGLPFCEVDDTLYEPIRQAGGVVTASPRREAARRAFDALSLPSSQETLRRLGYRSP